MEKITDIDLIIQQSLERDNPTIIAIDGPATSGKTTLANKLKEKYHLVLVSMDHFFLPMHMKTSKRLAEIGGNIDYKRVEEEVCIPFKNREFYQYRAFNCQTNSYEEKERQEGNVLLLEGVYAIHPKLQKYIDYALVLEISSSEQMTRLKKRNTPQIIEKYIREWIPLENKYFEYLRRIGE